MGLTKFPGGIGFLKESMTASVDGLSPAIWHDCPLIQMAVDPTIGVVAGDDFTFVQAASGFPYAISGTNGTFTAVDGVQYGQAKLATAGASNDECYVTSNNNAGGLIKADASSTWWFEARVKVSQTDKAQGVFVGLAEEKGVGADFMTDNTMALKVVDYLGFQILSPSNIAAVWQTVMALNGGARVAIDSNAGTATTSFTKLGMKSVAGTVRFYIDGKVLGASVASSATNFPLNQVMQITFATKAGQATANILTLDWWKAAQLR